MSQLQSNTMSTTAETIRELLAEAETLAARSIDKMLEAGHALVQAKAECKHGEWLPFLERAGIHERQARRLMQLANSGLTSDTVSDLGGIKGALEFLSRRRLPLAHEGLCITPNSNNENPLEAHEAAFIWPSRHAGFFHGAYFSDDGNGGMNVTYSKRPISETPLAGERESLVWIYEERMATPIEDRHYHRLTLPQVFAVADALGIVDTMYEASAAESESLDMAQSVRTLESLSDLYGDALERLRLLMKERTIENYAATGEALEAVSEAILTTDDPKILHRIAMDKAFSNLSARVDTALTEVAA